MAEQRTWTEEIEIAGRDLVGCVERAIREGNVRRVIVRDAAGTVLIELPLAAGVAVGGVLVLAAPVLAALGAMAALVTNCKLQVVRAVDADDVPDAEPAPAAGPAVDEAPTPSP
jgi:hypothetical protein